MKKKQYLILAFCIVGIAIGGVVFYIKSSTIIPRSIRKQTSFAILYPANSTAKIDKSSFKYDDNLKNLSFVVTYLGKKITFAEQATPDIFVDDDTYYGRFAEKLGSFEGFDSLNGRVDITKQIKAVGETGLMNAKGTLLFARTDTSMQQEDWKKLFNALIISKPL